jgi:hypothetical protein
MSKRRFGLNRFHCIMIIHILKALRGVVIRSCSLNEAPLGLFKFISDYLPYFEKINIFFNITTKKFELIYKD